MTDHIPRPQQCNAAFLGCGKSFPEESYNWKEHLCKECIERYSKEYGINPIDIGYVNTAGSNVRFYFSEVPGAHKLTLREKIRIIMIALGVNVMEQSDRERNGAKYLGEKFPQLSARKGALTPSIVNPSGEVGGVNAN